MNKKIITLGGVIVLLIIAALIIRFTGLQTAISVRGVTGWWLLPVVTIAAIIDSINPCAFSILLLTIAFLFSMGQMRSRILQIGVVYVLGIFVVYVLIGLGILQTLQLFSIPHFMARVGAILIAIWGILELLNAFFPRFPIRLKIPHGAHRSMAKLMEKASLLTALGLGVLVGLCEFPCTGGPYLLILGLLHDQTTFMKGLAYLIFYNLIFVAPLIVILFIASDKTLLEKAEAWKKSNNDQMRIWSGLAMIILGAIIYLFS